MEQKILRTSDITFEDREKYITTCCEILLKQENVEDVVVINRLGNPVRSTLDPDVSLKYGGLVDELIKKCAAAVKAIDDSELDEIRVKTKKHELYILPDQYELTFAVTQTPLIEIHPD